MSPSAAATLVGLGIVGLILLERDRHDRTSGSLVLAVAWFCVGASRMPSEWFGGMRYVNSPDQYLAGSPIDRAVLSLLLAAGVLILATRGRRSIAFLAANRPLLVFFVYCAASVLWSDFPLVAFKRWTKGIGNVVMALVVLTDPNPSAAIRRFFAWCGFVLIPISVLVIAYFPDSGRVVNRWTGTAYYTGATTDKNELGAICLVLGLAAMWRILEARREFPGSKRIRTLAVHGLVLALSLWLLGMADSSMAVACFAVGSALMMLTATGAGRRPVVVHATLITLTCVGLATLAFPSLYEAVVGALGRDIHLTGRWELWNVVLREKMNPWIGTGFESFWLGDRATHIWETYYFHPNQAHNGYLETYLTLGWTGVVLLAVLIAAGYRNVIAGLKQRLPSSTLKLALFVTAILFNLTEAVFRVMHPLWIAFLIAVIAVPDTPSDASR